MDVEDFVLDKKKPSLFWELIKIGLMLVFIFYVGKFVLFMWSLDGGTRASNEVRPPSCGGGASMAQIMAQNFVKRDLKAPRSASFSRSNVESGKDCTFRVTGAVDAQNSFGAMLRTNYSITLQYNAKTKKWQKLR